MTQPGSATVISPGRVVVPAGLSAVASTGTTVPGATGGVSSTATSAVTSAPGVRPVSVTGSGVATPGPPIPTVTPALASVTMAGPALTRRTRMIWRGRSGVPPNRSVESTAPICMGSCSHGGDQPGLRCRRAIQSASGRQYGDGEPVAEHVLVRGHDDVGGLDGLAAGGVRALDRHHGRARRDRQDGRLRQQAGPHRQLLQHLVDLDPDRAHALDDA